MEPCPNPLCNGESEPGSAEPCEYCMMNFEQADKFARGLEDQEADEGPKDVCIKAGYPGQKSQRIRVSQFQWELAYVEKDLVAQDGICKHLRKAIEDSNKTVGRIDWDKIEFKLGTLSIIPARKRKAPAA